MADDALIPTRRRAGHAQPVIERVPRAFAQFPLDNRQKAGINNFQNTLPGIATATAWFGKAAAPNGAEVVMTGCSPEFGWIGKAIPAGRKKGRKNSLQKPRIGVRLLTKLDQNNLK